MGAQTPAITLDLVAVSRNPSLTSRSSISRPPVVKVDAADCTAPSWEA